MIKKVLIAYDGTKQAKNALEFALDFCKKYHAELFVIGVIVLLEMDGESEIKALLEKEERRYRGFHRYLKKKVAAAKIKTSYKLAVGHPAAQIVSFADEIKADHIIIGYRGKSFFEHWKHAASISKQVVTEANCNVTVVH